MSSSPSIPLTLTDVKVECDGLISDDGHGRPSYSSNLENASDFHRMDFQITKKDLPHGGQSIVLKEEVIKDEDDLAIYSEYPDDLIPDCHDWKLKPNVECRVRLEKMKSFSSEKELNGSTYSQNRRNVGKSTWVEPAVPHVDLDLSDMFLIQKTIKVEPSDLDINSEDPLGLGDFMDGGETKEVNSRSSNNNSDGSFGSSPLHPDVGNLFTIENLKLCGSVKISEEPMTDLNSESIRNTKNGDSCDKKLNKEKVTHKCDVCGKHFARKRNLNTHKLTHTGERPHTCDLCGKCFTFKCHLTEHKTTHTGEKRVQCDVCGKRFSRKSVLNRHKLMHPGETPYKCHTCGDGFTLTDDLNRHKLTHTAENRHRCDICQKCFVYSWDLTRHKRVHSGDKPYECEVCGMTFPYNFDLTRHKRTHTGDKPYSCDICGKDFAQKWNLNKHKVIHNSAK